MTEPQSKSDMITKGAIIVGLAVVVGIFLYERLAFQPDTNAGLNPAPAEVSILKSDTVQGGVRYRPVAGDWQPLPAGTELHVGDSIETQAGGKAVLVFNSGGYVRLNENTSLVVSSNNQNEIKFTQTGGRSYHRVSMPASTKYRVDALGQTVTSSSSSFDLTSDADKKVVIVKMFQKSSLITVAMPDKPMIDRPIDAGGQLTIDLVKKTSEYRVMTGAELSNPWLKYNRDEDAKAGFDLGFLTAPPAPRKFLPVRRPVKK